jgi:phosphoribosyl 1,2-cyclic phosphodiesterase
MIPMVISSGSEGNAVLYHEHILVDIGVPFASLKSILFRIQLVLLTHEHKDHINIDTLRRLCKERPTVRVGCGKWMLPHLEGIKNVDVFSIGQEYNYGYFSLIPVKLYHDVENCGYKIFRNGYKIFHATDTAHLSGIEARGYDLYAIEHNYDAEVIGAVIAAKEANGQYAYEKGAINSHLSEQAARQFIFNNAGENYEVLRLHESKREYSKI